ncbi:MAG: hypothetical protein ABI889_15140 [Gemmatimonadota bacterium]
MMRNPSLCAAMFAALTASSLAGQSQTRLADTSHALGTVHFATSCRREVAPQFDHAVALLHSFEFGAAIQAFDNLLASDTTCSMAYWGIALARWTNPMSAGKRAPALLAQGRQAADAGARLSAAATPRERSYLAAVHRLYEDFEHTDQKSRITQYERAMAELVAQQPADTEAKIFYALALVASASPTDKTYAHQRQAGAMLEALWAKQPNHPGLAHYIIHAYDVPALAPHAAAAARRYAAIAPAAAHALHMPSHTFTRLGLWESSARTNRRSVAVALRDSSIAEALHASDYMEYAYLQLERNSAAKAVLESLPALAQRFDPNAVTGAAPGSAGVFALAAIPARYALERRAWKEAAALVPTPTAYPYAEAMTYFAHALGSTHLRKQDAARGDVDSLNQIHRRLLGSAEPYWAEQVDIERLGAQAWMELAAEKREEALAHMSEAAEREDATEKSAVTPGPLAPARELLGDMLLEVGRPRDALVEYRRTLVKEPKRFRSVHGAWQAATAAGDRTAAARYASELRTVTLH